MTIFNNTLLIGKGFHHFETLDSTNDYALDLYSKNRPVEGTIILADFQTAGRGQFGRTWEAQRAENLTLSLVLYPKFIRADQQFLLNQALSLGVLDFLRVFPLQDVSLKWPNDLYIGNRKVGGILIQNVLRGMHLEAAVIGIGLNINQTEFGDHLERATSIRLETGQAYERLDLLAQLVKTLEVRYLALRAGRTEQLQLDYLKNLKFFNKWQTYQDQSGLEFQGKIVGVKPDGKLEIELSNKERRSFVFQEISPVF